MRNRGVQAHLEYLVISSLTFNLSWNHLTSPVSRLNSSNLNVNNIKGPFLEGFRHGWRQCQGPLKWLTNTNFPAEILLTCWKPIARDLALSNNLFFSTVNYFSSTQKWKPSSAKESIKRWKKAKIVQDQVRRIHPDVGICAVAPKNFDGQCFTKRMLRFHAQLLQACIKTKLFFTLYMYSYYFNRFFLQLYLFYNYYCPLRCRF